MTIRKEISAMIEKVRAVEAIWEEEKGFTQVELNEISLARMILDDILEEEYSDK